MKRIGIFTYDFYPIIGGQGRHIIELYHRIYNKKGFLIFSPNANNLKNHKTLFNFTTKLGKHLLYSFLLNFKIKGLIKKYNLDIIHLHCGPGGTLILKKSKSKFICTVHHTYYQQQEYVPSQKWKYFLYLLEKKMYKNADKLVMVSEDTKKVLIKNHGVFPSKIEVIPNGVDFKKFKKNKRIKKIKNSLLFVGRLDKRKGIDFLVKTIPFIKKEIPDIKLFVIGDGKMRKKLEKYVRNNDIESNVKFLGFVPNSYLLRWYNRCQLTIVPSVFEGFGLTVIESLACGTPVIATNVDGIRSIIKNNKNGILVEYGNKKELAGQVVRLLNNPSLRKEFSIEGLKTIKEKFDWDEITLKTLKVYKNVKY